MSCFSYIIARINDRCLVKSRNSFANTWVHSRCFGGSVLLILCEHLGSFPVFWWIRVAHPLRTPGFIPGVLVDPCCSSFASTWVHSRCFGGSVLLILCEHLGSFPVFWWIRVAHPLRTPGFIPGVLVDPCCSSFANTWVHSRCFGGSVLLILCEHLGSFPVFWWIRVAHPLRTPGFIPGVLVDPCVAHPLRAPGSFPMFWWIRVVHPLQAPGSFPVFWWIRVAHPLRTPGFIPGVLVDPCCSSFASTWVHSRCFGGSVLLILCEHLGHSRCFGGSVLLILCEHLGSFPMFWWIRVAHPLRAPGFIPGVLVDPCCSSFASTWVHSRCFGGSVLLILCEHLGSFPVFWWIRVAHPLRAPGFIPGVLVDPCCLSFASTWVHSRCFGGSVLLILCEHLGSFPVFWWIRVAHPLRAPGFIPGVLVDPCCSSFANTWVHSRCFVGSVLLILCEHLGSFPVFWWIRVAHPLRAPGFIPGVLVDPCCLSFASTWVHSRCFGGSVLLILCEHLGSFPVFWWIRVAHPLRAPGFIPGVLVDPCCSSFANTWVHSRCFVGSVLLILCEHLGSFPVFWWIRVAHPLRAPGFIPGVLVDPCCSSFASTWVHSRCFGGSVLLILCEHLGSFPVFWWIRVVHPLRAPRFIPGVLVDPCCSSFASTWVHSRCFGGSVLFILCEHLGSFPVFCWIRVAHPLSFLCNMYLFCTPSFCVLFRILPVSVDSHYLFGPSDFSNVYLLLDAIRMMSVLY